jgi:hypothetical protein
MKLTSHPEIPRNRVTLEFRCTSSIQLNHANLHILLTFLSNILDSERNETLDSERNETLDSERNKILDSTEEWKGQETM